MSFLQAVPNYHGLSDLEPEQLQQFLATKPFKFTVGRDRVEFYIQRGFVSRLSTPLNALVNSWSGESLEGCISWEDIDTDVFSRFAQYLYTGDYTGFTPVEKEYTSGHSEEANTVTIEAAWNGPSSERPPLFPTSATAQLANVFGGTAPSKNSQKNGKADPFKLPYSLRSYERAAAERIQGRTHALRCQVNGASSGGARRKVACDCISAGESSPSERKRDFIRAFMTKQGHKISRFAMCRNMCQIKPGPQTKNFEPVFIGHAKIWNLAAAYSIDSLTDLAYAKLAYELSHWTISESAFIPEFGGLVRYVYSDRMTAGYQLQQLVAEFAACVVEDVCGLEGWSALLNEVPDFAAGLVKQMTNRID